VYEVVKVWGPLQVGACPAPQSELRALNQYSAIHS
jgi:hypothetical protein